MHYNFKNDLEHGKRYERRAQLLLEEDFGKLENKNGKNSGFDLEGGGITIEVKTDFISRNTHRVGVEYYNRGVPSGISVTTADYYFIICYDQDYSMIVEGVKKNGWWVGLLLNTSVLKELCKSCALKKVRGGDDKQASMVLISVEDVREASNKIYPLQG